METILPQTGYNTVISFQQDIASQLPTTSDHCPLDIGQRSDTDTRSSTDKSIVFHFHTSFRFAIDGAIIYLSNKRSYQFCGDLSTDLRDVFEDTSIIFKDKGKS
ncbi:hypothetical protein EG68_05953 [Paragonimus skrjabini miyazakii]|uniref:Uncharacterized protein n=1 Tax=Paragonimus skrjabini miyazakii TaxID=59628 RepID=A0A8S9YPR2_9TREM|nr:hypothetical protein EG68_05953 [Paragonimus skrjabini miyazakii]